MRLHMYVRFFVVLTLAVCLGITMAHASGSAKLGAPAPDFTLTDLHGENVQLSSLKGNVVVLEWTNPNCPFVVRHYKDELMTSLQKRYGEQGVVWLVINSTNPKHRDYETPEQLHSIYSKWSSAYAAMLMDPDGTVGKTYNARTTPHMFIIDTEGTLVYDGAIDDDPRGTKESRINYVAAALNALIAGKPVTVSTTTPYGCSVKY